MKIIILYIFLARFLFVCASMNNEIENVYIDALIQHYKMLGDDLWKFIEENRISQPIVVVDKIITEHQTFFKTKDLEELMLNDYRLKFQFYYETNSFKNCSQEDRLLKLVNELKVPSNVYEKLTLTDSEIYCVGGVTSYYRKKAKKPIELFGLILKDADTSSCNYRTTKVIESASQNIFMFYQIMSSTLLIQFASEQRFLMVQAVRDGFDETTVAELRDKFDYKYRRIADRAGEYLKMSNRDIWMCDPDFYMKNDTSIQITNFLRGYVDNEINLNVHNSCDRSCSQYKTARQHGCYEGTFCDDQRKAGRKDATCTGQIFDCTFIESDMQICLSGCDVEDEKQQNERKGVTWHFLKAGGCTVHVYSLMKEIDRKKTFPRVPTTPEDDTITSSMTLVDVSEESDAAHILWKLNRGISIGFFRVTTVFVTARSRIKTLTVPSVYIQWSQISVETSVGLTSKNGIFSWTISQSRLLSDGRVQQINETNPDECNTVDAEDELVIHDEFQDISSGIDYHTLTWRSRAVDLATITAPPGSVLTGIRFIVVKDHLSFEIRATQFDFNSGRLDGRSEWISDKIERSVLLLETPEPSYPIHTNDQECKRSIPNFTPNKFVKFRPTDSDKDAGQTTVPFIDTQLVRPMHLTLLSGVGLYYKGRPGFGGFIAPKLVVYDMSSYLGV